MSQTKWYRGTDAFVVCQANDGSRLCFKPCRTHATGLVGGRVSIIYECSAGHRFALTDVRLVRGPHPFSTRGELDSGESDTSHEADGSGESGRSHGTRIQPNYTDYRKVTMIPKAVPVFGEP